MYYLINLSSRNFPY